jgi:hypothetical protein
MPDQDPKLKYLHENHQDEIERLGQDVQNTFSFGKVSFIFERLKMLGPWKPKDFNMELIFEIDMMQSALAVEYSRVFNSGPRKVNRDRVPQHLRAVHDKIMELRNERFAHVGNHASVENFVELKIEDNKVIVKAGATHLMQLGAPQEWGELIIWLGEHLNEQTAKQLVRLTTATGLEWVEQTDLQPEQE